MMRGKSGKWLGGLVAVVLGGSLVLGTFGGGVTAAQAHDRDYKNPLRQILTKLDEILVKLNAATGAGGGTGNPALPRFTVLVEFSGAAVRDNSTGLVWEQTPIATTSDWTSARGSCLNKSVGNMRGWRLPSVVELTSLIDSSPTSTPPYVPSTVFTGVQPNSYWSATSNETNTNNNKWTVNFADGLAGTTSKFSPTVYVWCVRGEMQDSVY